MLEKHRITSLNLIFCLLTASLIFLLVNPQKAIASCVEIGGDERLQNLCLLNKINGKIIDQQTAYFIDRRLKKTGIREGLRLPDGGVDLNFAPVFSFSPYFQYDPNINGGNPRRSLQVGNLTFQRNKSYDMQDGLVGGLNAKASFYRPYAEGKYFQYFGSEKRSRGLSVSDRIAESFHNFCSFNKFSQTFYLDLCASSSKTEKTLTSKTDEKIRTNASFIFEPSGTSQLHLKFGSYNLIKTDFQQPGIEIGFDVIKNGKSFYGVALNMNDKIDGYLTTRHSLEVKTGFFMLGRAIRFSASLKEANGSHLLGVARKTSTKSLNLQFPYREGVLVSVGYEQVDAKIDYFTSVSPMLNVTFTH